MSQYGNYTNPTFDAYCKVNDVIEQSIKKAEFKLDKKIALFENHLSYQRAKLEIGNIFFKSAYEIIPHLIEQSLKIRQLNFNMYMICSQPIPRFKSGGIEYVKEEGAEFILKAK